MENFGNHTDLGGPAGDRLEPTVIHCRDLGFSYGSEGFRLSVPELHILRGQKIALTGPSGCGKTTLIHLLAGILKSQSGILEVEGVELAKYSDRDLKDFRILKLGLIFQEFELLQYLNSYENILLPFRLNPVLALDDSKRKNAMELLDRVGLKDKEGRYPKALSQGERQRVAVCRALITKPSLLLCDEPTANLDPENRDRILKVLFGYCRGENASLIMVTHDHEILDHFDQRIDIREFLPKSTPAP